MPKFLNTPLLNSWIPKIINEAKKELVIITPFMESSQENLYNLLVNANKRGIETFLVYKEEKLSHNEKTKLLQINNLNLFCHKYLHSKCYINESHILITSMNLY